MHFDSGLLRFSPPLLSPCLPPSPLSFAWRNIMWEIHMLRSENRRKNTHIYKHIQRQRQRANKKMRIHTYVIAKTCSQLFSHFGKSNNYALTMLFHCLTWTVHYHIQSAESSLFAFDVHTSLRYSESHNTLAHHQTYTHTHTHNKSQSIVNCCSRL